MARRRPLPGLFALALAAVLGPACSSGSSSPSPAAPTGATVMFDATADLTSSAHFFDFPWPSDLRLDASGMPDLSGMANPSGSAVFAGLLSIAQQRKGFPMLPVAWFRFTDDVAARSPGDTIAAAPGSPILLVDVDPKSSTVGTLLPTVAETLVPDGYVPSSVLAVAPRPGIVLEPSHAYAFVVLTSASDAKGHALGVAPALAQALAGGGTDAVSKLFAPLPAALKKAGVDVAKVAAATVFTTGDVVTDLFNLTSGILKSQTATLTNVAVDPHVLDTNDRMCELQGQITYPEYQAGYASPPYDTGGLFTLDASGNPVQQGMMTVPVTITLPKQPMPSGGFPIIAFFHGTGGVSTAIADRGPWRPIDDAATECPPLEPPDEWNGVWGCNTAGQGPGWVMAARGVAMAASSLPLDPQRWPAGQDLSLPEWLDINNVAATRDDFRQGAIEQRLFFAALQKLTIDPPAVSACTGLSLPSGETAYHFVSAPLLAQGQSMGAMYANILSAIEPTIEAVVPTGSGGFWSYFILLTQTVPNIDGDLAVLLDVKHPLTFLHPTMQVAELGLEPIDPAVYMPRIGKNPLPGHPVRPIYEPHGYGDSYFPTPVQDAVAMSYGNREAGAEVWSTMQPGLALEGLSGFLPYPVSNDVTSGAGAKYTGVVVQYMGDGLYDPHAIYTQLDAVKYQYGCFFQSFLATGTATVPAPANYDVPCPM